MNFKEEILKKYFITHQLSQIAREGEYYLSPLRVICYIPNNCTHEQLVDILKENDMFIDEGFVNDNTIALLECTNGSSIIKEELTDEPITDLKTSKDPNNCGYELHSNWDEIGYMNRGEQKWFLEQLKKNNLKEYEDYTISVDNLEAPTKAFIYMLDDNDNSHLILTCKL